MLKVALCCILFVSFWALLHGVQLPKVSKLKRELSDQQMRFEEELAQQHKRLMNMKHGLGREKRQEDTPRTCSEVKKREGSAKDGTYTLTNGVDLVPSYCDMNTAGAEWTVFQRRISDSVSFDRNWADYKIGFGNMTGNFWWGNDNLAAFTSNGKYVLRADLQDADGRHYYAEYEDFSIGDENARYELSVGESVGEFSGNLSNSMIYHRRYFSTPDKDNDRDGDRNCAQMRHSGWWFARCVRVNLNGVYTGTKYGGIVWDGDNYKWTEMKFRSM